MNSCALEFMEVTGTYPGFLRGEDEFVCEVLFAAVAGSRLQMIQRCTYI